MRLRSAPVFALGFRPFFLLAAAAAAFAIPLWLLAYVGLIYADGYLYGTAWHAHEMIFGFAATVITGFLLTAVRNWTSQPTTTGASLAALSALWLLARVLLPVGPHLIAALVDLAFLPAVAVAIAVPLKRSGNRRNYFFVALLLLLAGANALFHAAQLGYIDISWQTPLHAALFIVTFIVAVMGGRVIPSFTANAIPGVKTLREPWLEKASLATLAAALICVLWVPSSVLTALLCAGAAALHLWRWALWSPWSTRRQPILWVLHLSYLWIPLALALFCASALTSAVPYSAAVHALSIGAIGGMIIGMTTRTARGHTGRPLQTDATETAAYVLVQLAALARLTGVLLLPSMYLITLVTSAALWSTAFTFYLLIYWPVLTQPRVDGRPG